MLDHQKELLLEQMKMHNKCSVRVGGYCMSPVIRDNAEITVEKADISELVPGEIVAYFLGARLFVHRLLERKGESLKLCGDNPNAGPHEIPQDAVLGRVREIRNPWLIKRILKKTGEKYEEFRSKRD